MLSWGELDASGPATTLRRGTAAALTVAVSPARTSHSVTVDYRLAGGAIREVAARPAPSSPKGPTRLFRAILPGQPSGLIEFLPVLRLRGRPISPRLADSTAGAQYEMAQAQTPGSGAPPIFAREPRPRWSWRAEYLFSLTAALRADVIGVTPDGLRIAWRVEQGRFDGPRLRGVILPGATDWMRIRDDGVAVVSVKACLETSAGARIYVSYGGVVDLGSDGYARALRGEFDRRPPLTTAPTFQTSEKSLLWLNRAQCVAVGRGLTTTQIAYDVYSIEVGGETSAA